MLFLRLRLLSIVLFLLVLVVVVILAGRVRRLMVVVRGVRGGVVRVMVMRVWIRRRTGLPYSPVPSSCCRSRAMLKRGGSRRTRRGSDRSRGS